MNNFLHGLTEYSNIKLTENGSKAYKSTNSALYDCFAFGGAYRKRSDEDCILLFKNAYKENPEYALKCLFYLRDCRGGAGERRFWRVCAHWLACEHPEAAIRNIKYAPIVGRWDDLYTFFDTPAEDAALKLIQSQLELDVQCTTPSLCAKWVASENASSQQTRAIASRIRKYLKLTHREYRKLLSALRTRINVLEKLMSENRWDEIVFDKIPSKAGLIYRNAFARHDITKAYEKFMKDKNTKVNSDVLNPVDIADKVFSIWNPSELERLTLNKYWKNLKDYYNGRQENGIAVVDVSGSMTGQPMNAAVSMGAYIAERGKGPFANHFITFSGNPQLVKFEGVDIYDKFRRARDADWGMNTNIEATFNLLLNTAIKNNCTQEEIPSVIYIFSDMEFDACATIGEPVLNRYGDYNSNQRINSTKINTFFETLKDKWSSYGYKLPHVIFWNLDARHNTIPAIGDGFSFVSGFSMDMIEQILSGEDGYSLMIKKLNTDRYKNIK